MKSLILLPVLACGVIAQGPPQEPKIPRPQSVGRAEKVSEAPAAKLEHADSTAPATVREPRRTLSTKDQAIADQGRQGIKSAFDDPDFVAFDDPTNGPIWAVSQNWKASFDAQGFTFIGRPAPEATALQPIRFHLAGARVGSRDLELQDAQPVRKGRHVEFRRGGLVEAVDVSGRGAEQTFTITELPQRGQLTLDLAVDTQLAASNGQSGVVFQGAFDQIGYSAAVAIDANGNRVAAETTFRDGRIAIAVPAAFVESAALPICIDPWITAIQVYSLTSDLADPDIAWDDNNGVWAVAFARYFGGSDWDCYVQRVAPYNPMTLVGGITVIDGTTDAWQRPRIADLKAYAEFMVACQVRVGTNPFKVAGRLMSNQGPVNSNQFDVYSSSVDDYHCDIGGDMGGAPTYFTVVWEHAFSATDHDIYARQVTSTGALRGTSPIFVQTNTTNQTWPSVSKSDGGLPYATQRFTIVYQQTFSASDQDIYGAMLTWDGNFVPVGTSNTFVIDASGLNDVLPQASSPALPAPDGSRSILVVYERTNSNGGDIAATCIDQAGAYRASGNISVLEGDAFRLPWPQHAPSVDCDGSRFVVGYHEIYNGNTTVNDNDTRVSLVALTGNQLLVEEAGVTLGFSTNREFNIQVATVYGGSGLASPRANTTNDRDNVPSGFAIDCYSYDSGPQGRFDTRSTSCGVLGITHTGTPITGNTISFALTPSPYLSGFVVGAPASVPIAPCPGCTLGVNGNVVSGLNWSLLIPNNPAYIGWMFSVQGFVFHGAGGPCLGSIRVSDTIDVTVY